MRSAAESASAFGTSGNSDFFAMNMIATMPRIVAPSAVWTTFVGRASPIIAPKIELVEAMSATGDEVREGTLIESGLVVTAFGWRMLNSGVSADAHAATAGNKAELDAFYPFTMPLTVGPGSMSVAIALGSQRPVYTDFAQLAVIGAAALAGIVAICITIYLCYRFAERTVTRLGPSGTNVLVRLMAFILLCIGIQIIWHGWTGLMALPH